MERNQISPIQRGILLMVLDEGGRIDTESLYDYVEERRPTTDEDGEPIDDQDPYESSREEIGALEGAGLLGQDDDGMAVMGYSSLTDAGREMAVQLVDGPEAILEQLQEILWPEGDAEHPWSPDTLDEIAKVLIGRGYCPAGLRE